MFDLLMKEMTRYQRSGQTDSALRWTAGLVERIAAAMARTEFGRRKKAATVLPVIFPVRWYMAD
jgi:hypothetical protein